MDMVEPQQRDILSQRAAMIANSPHRQLPEGEENLIKRQIKILVQILERTAMDMSELENRLCTVLVAPPPITKGLSPPIWKKKKKRDQKISSVS